MPNEIPQLEEKKAFLKEVYAEIETIIEKATDEEKARLDPFIFNPNHREFCIYGLMTGRCNSKRAHELMEKTVMQRYVLYMTKMEFYILEFIDTPDVNISILEYIKGEASRPILPLPRQLPES